MKNQPLKTQILLAQDKLRSLPLEMTTLYYNTKAIRHILEERVLRFKALMQTTLGASGDGSISHTVITHVNGMVNAIDSAQASHLTNAIALRDLLEKSSEFQNANATIPPIEAEIERLQAAELAERQLIADRHHALKKTIENLKTESEASISKNRDVIAQREEIARLETAAAL